MYAANCEPCISFTILAWIFLKQSLMLQGCGVFFECMSGVYTNWIKADLFGLRYAFARHSTESLWFMILTVRWYCQPNRVILVEVIIALGKPPVIMPAIGTFCILCCESNFQLMADCAPSSCREPLTEHDVFMLMTIGFSADVDGCLFLLMG